MKLLELEIKKFKGIDDLILKFDGEDTAILGTNEVGKTTIADAYRWLLFDKNSKGDSQFGIKPLNNKNNEIHHLNSIVRGVFLIDGIEKELKKDYHEKWTKKRGTSQQTFEGHTTDYYVDEVPVKKKEYEKEIKDIIDEDVFKLITDPLHFNEQLHWKEQKEIIFSLIDMPDKEEIATEAELYYLVENMGNNNIEKHQKVLKSKMKNINEELENIQPRIDEVSKNLGQKEGNIDELEKKLEVKENQKEKYQEKLAELKSEDNTEAKEKFLDLKEKYNEKKDELLTQANNLLSDIHDKLSDKKSSINKTKNQIENYKTTTENNQDNLKSLREELEEWQNKEFDEDKGICSACEQELPEDQIKEHKEKFNKEKSNKLEELNEKINKLEKDIENGKKEIKKLKDKLEVMNEEKEKLEQRIEKGNKYKDRVKSGDVNELSNLKEDLKAAKDEIDNDSTDQSKLNKLEGKIENINEDIKKLNKQISNIENIEKAEKRIEELQEKEETLSNKYEDLEKELYDTEKYIHTKIDMVESDVNDLFEITKFKLFEEQVNGAIKETCKALKDGVPYSDMNTGSQYQVGIDIINVLSDYYNFNAPVFIDNRERIAKLPKIESQTIHLIMSPQRKEMEIVDLSNKSADEIVEEEGGIKEESLF